MKPRGTTMAAAKDVAYDKRMIFLFLLIISCVVFFYIQGWSFSAGSNNIKSFRMNYKDVRKNSTRTIKEGQELAEYLHQKEEELVIREEELLLNEQEVRRREEEAMRRETEGREREIMLSRKEKKVQKILEKYTIFATSTPPVKVEIDRDPIEQYIDKKTEEAYEGWQQISLENALKRFKPNMGDECVKNTPKLVCPKSNQPIKVSEVVLKGCRTFASHDGAMPATRDAVPSSIKPLFNDREYILPFEARRLKEPHLKDLKLLPDPNKGRIVVLSPPTSDDEVVCEVGQKLEFRIDLYDSYGNPRTKGDDDVRVWLIQGNTAKNSFYSATAHVKDLNNGSYHVSTFCLWEKKTELKVAVAYPREYLRAVTNQYRLQTTRTISVLFSKPGSEAKSITACAGTPLLPYSCMCNFTDWNKQSFYCGHPVHPELSCKDVKQVRAFWFHTNINTTKAEETMMGQMSRKTPGTMLKHNIKINAKPGTLPKLPGCSQTSFNTTWISKSPQGYWTPGSKWKSLLCDNSKTITGKDKCLQKITVWVFGDSNAMKLRDQFKKLLNCNFNTKYGWPSNISCFNYQTGNKMHYYPHENPLFVGWDKYSLLHWFGDVAHLIDNKVPSTGKNIILVHYYMHVAAFHYSTIYQRLIAARDAISRALARNPEVYIAFRGPHIMYLDWTANHAAGGDTLITEYIPMVKEIFWPLRNRLIFLDGYDMSVANENNSIHPNIIISQAMVQLLLNFICGR